MTTFPDLQTLVNAWPSLAEFASACAPSYEAAKKWRKRGAIDPKYWPKIIEDAERRGIEGVTAEVLMKLHADAEAESEVSG